MAEEKITQLAALTAPSSDDLLVIVDDPSGSTATKKITLANLFKDMQPRNLLENGSFESWGAGVAVAPDGWSFGGAGAAIAREATTIKRNTYSAKITGGATEAYLTRNHEDYVYFRGRVVTLGAWVWCATANAARIRINDGATVTSSAYHPGGSAWKWLSVSQTVNAAATQLIASMRVEVNAIVAYFDGAMLVEGAVAWAYAPHRTDGYAVPILVTAAPTDTGKAGEVRWYSSGGTRRLYMSDGTGWTYVAIASS